jgi:hypothetical protein
VTHIPGVTPKRNFRRTKKELDAGLSRDEAKIVRAKKQADKAIQELEACIRACVLSRERQREILGDPVVEGFRIALKDDLDPIEPLNKGTPFVDDTTPTSYPVLLASSLTGSFVEGPRKRPRSENSSSGSPSPLMDEPLDHAMLQEMDTPLAIRNIATMLVPAIEPNPSFEIPVMGSTESEDRRSVSASIPLVIRSSDIVKHIDEIIASGRAPPGLEAVVAGGRAIALLKAQKRLGSARGSEVPATKGGAPRGVETGKV